VHYIRGFSQDNSADSTTPACTGYWELSYKHPYLKKADSLWEMEKFDQAVVFYRQALAKFQKKENWEGLLKSRNRIADSYRISYKPDTALTILNQNLNIVQEQLDSNPVDLAEVYFLIGRCYDWARKFDQALTAYNKALEIRVALYGEYHIDVAWEYIAMGDMYWYDDQNLNALKQLSKAVDVLLQAGCHDSQELGDTYYNLTTTYRALRDLERAEIYGIKALALFENNFSKKARCYNSLANIKEDKNDHRASLDYNNEAIRIWLEHQPLSNSQLTNLANCLHSVANVYSQVQQHDSAHQFYQRSLKLYEQLDDQNEVILVYQNIGINYYRLTQYDSAEYFLTKAVNLRQRIYGEKHFRTSGSLREKGTYYLQLGELDSALHYYQQSIVAAAGPEFNSFHPGTNPAKESLAADDDGSLLNALYLKGSVLKRIYRQNHELRILELSLKTMLLAIELMDINQELYQLEGSTLFMAEDNYSVFENALDVCYHLYQLTDNREFIETAFFIMEKSKARLLFDTFSDLQQSRMVGIPDSLVNVENTIKTRYAALSRDLEIQKKQDPQNNVKIQELEDQVFETIVELEKFRESLETRYPLYTSTTKNKPLDLNALHKKITGKSQVLLNYFWGDSTMFAVVIMGDNINFFKQPVDTLEQLVTTYQYHIVNEPKFTNQAAWFKEYVNTAYGLYQRLFNGVKIEDNPVVIAADGPLRFIPFEGLVTSLPETQNHDYSTLDYLVHQVPTSYVYSANLWALEPEIESQTLKVLGFSHSDPNPVGDVGKNELPGTGREIDLLKSQLSGSFFSGLQATKQQFFDHAQDYDIVHLAIHGISDSVSRLNNRLLFRDADNPDGTDPLYTYELYNLQLNTRLAVLSACESGIGRNFRGEGVYSMSRAFSYAGCPTTVMSLWKISDKTTPEILGEFYRQINRGTDIDQALRQAKLKYLKDNPGNLAHPNYWSAMVVHGATDEMVQRSWVRLALPVLLTLMVLGFVLIKRSRKRISVT
jgi:CHAT domain-containing protein